MPNYLLKEDEFKLLQEDGYGILLEDQPSASASPSLSPSVGYVMYTKGDYAALPSDDTDLETSYTAQQVIDVQTYDGVRVGQTGTQEYMIHQFKDFIVAGSDVTLVWIGRSTLAPSSSAVKLQIYNMTTDLWEDCDSNTTASANTDFTLSCSIYDLADYKGLGNVISARVWQLAI